MVFETVGDDDIHHLGLPEKMVGIIQPHCDVLMQRRKRVLVLKRIWVLRRLFSWSLSLDDRISISWLMNNLWVIIHGCGTEGSPGGSDTKIENKKMRLGWK